MAKYHAKGNKQQQKKISKPKPKVEQTSYQAELARQAELHDMARSSDILTQVERLGDPRLQIAQRQALAAQIGRVQGNQHLQRVLQRDADDNNDGSRFQLSSPALSPPGYQGPSLGVGQLQLNTSPFQGLGVEDTFSPDRLFQPPPELLQQLIDQWVLQYRLLHPGPPLAESAWQQLWSAWRRLADRWLERGADAPLNAELAQDILREQAAEAVLRQQTIRTVLNPRSGGNSPSLAEIGDKVWPAFKKALEATQFYPRIKQNAEELARQHWPALIPTLGTALGAALGMGLSENNWTGMEQLSGLLPMLGTDIQLSEQWSMSLGFEESNPIRGAGEQGVVIGINPALGLKYKDENIQFSLESSVNLRFETGQGSDRGFQVQASPGAQATLRW